MFIRQRVIGAPLLDGEPQGFVDRTQATLTFNEGTRTVTITPVSGSFEIYSNSKYYRKSSAESIVISDTTGTHFVYYDNSGILVEAETFEIGIINRWCYVCFIYWNATDGVAIPDAINELHGIEFPADTHYYHHTTDGTKYTANGGIAVTVNATGDGSLLEHVQFSSTAGGIQDEDIPHTIAASLLTDNIPVIYRLGAGDGVWHKDSTSSAIVRATGTGRAAYNQFTGGSWQLIEVTNLKYVLAQLYAVPGITENYMIVMGVAEYNTAPAARAAARTEVLGITGIPTSEYKLIATLLVQTSDAYTNAVKSRIVEIATGESYVDWRYVSIVGGIPSITPN